ncbi:Ig-like domain-containing protein [Sphingobacterium paludis]|uniref:Ig-like domain-containing protein n=1 Tax=Sphingobacterium paludis TaxID=1476465 RepID=A0A4R7D766_9SPHI|nr:Ig-like domain-containing protein [Sphingobacterium paludis]TDS14836.1 Ig-like domain-containing protein [Sphingobacterium paludis]
MTQLSENNKSVSKGLKIVNFQYLSLVGFIILLLLTFNRCANVQRPTGGPKDSLPPKILNESPANFSRNFQDKEIVLTFDEYIKLNNQFKEFSISPDLDQQPLFKVRKKNLVIQLPDSMEANTTYTINFGKGLVDYNESNPIVNYNYVFSTGPELDSLSISGSVKNGFTKSFDIKKDENIKVLLIPTRQDSIFGKRKANIFTGLDSSGNFKFSNLREDTYRIYALKEQNNDRIFNGNDEWIGFLMDSIVLKKDTSNIQLEITKAYPKDFRTLEKKIEPTGNILLTFNKPINNAQVQITHPADINESKITRYSLNNDSVRIFIPNKELDSVKILLSADQNIRDTILIRTNKNAKYDREIKPIFNITNKVDRTSHIKLTSVTPLSNVDKGKIVLYEDSVSRRNFQLQQDSANQNLYHIRYNWRAKRNYELVIEENALRSPFDDVNKESKKQFTMDESDNYGNITFTVNGLDSTMQYIVELTNEEKEKVFDSRLIDQRSGKINYTKFPGGKYMLRVIYDANKNNKWDPADVYARKQAEYIWYLDKTFTIRANWDQNETITLPK